MQFRSRPERVLLPLAVVAMGLVAYSAYHSWSEFERANQHALASRAVLDHTSRLLAAVTDAETGQRGYLLTGKAGYLDPFNRGEHQAPLELAALQGLIGLRPDLKDPLSRLTPVVRLKLSELQESIDMRKREGPDAAHRLVASDLGRESMDSIRIICAQIMKAEYVRWESENLRRQNEGRFSLAVTLTGTLILCGLLALAIVLIHNTTEQRERLIAELHQRGELLQTTLASIGDGVIVTDAKGAVTFLNGVAQHLTGWSLEEARNQPLGTVFRAVHEETKVEIENPATKVMRVRGVAALAADTALLRRDGTSIPIADSGAPIRGRDGTVLGVVLVFRDISEARATERERRTMEERLQQAAKLESLGVLAGGIAHDFNNLLVGILGNASLSLETLPEDSEVRPMLDQVVTAAQRAADLTRQMLAYAGKGKFYVEKVRMGELVRDTLPLIQSSIPRSVRLEVEIHDDCLVEADATQLQQIIMNLVINAGEACSGRSGLVRVATSDLQIDQGAMPGVFGATSIEPGAYVCLEVRDNGTGMDQETLGKIFDPFFTTKFTGRGLGLAATLGIVRGHGGVLQVESKPGEGSRFRVLLPATGLPGRRPVVVVADGEARVREMAKMVLEHAGYEVVAVDSSAQAAAMATDYSGRVVAAVLVEARAEGLTEAVAEVRRLLPKAPVIVVSGMPEAQIRTMLDGVRVDGFLEKPYTAGLLSEKVKAVAGGELS